MILWWLNSWKHCARNCRMPWRKYTEHATTLNNCKWYSPRRAASPPYWQPLVSWKLPQPRFHFICWENEKRKVNKLPFQSITAGGYVQRADSKVKWTWFFLCIRSLVYTILFSTRASGPFLTSMLPLLWMAKPSWQMKTLSSSTWWGLSLTCL